MRSDGVTVLTGSAFSYCSRNVMEESFLIEGNPFVEITGMDSDQLVHVSLV